MSSDDWKALGQHKKDKFDNDRKLFAEQAKVADDGGWIKHTDWHWQRELNGKRLDYWPSRKKFMYEGQVMRGDVYDFMRRTLAKPPLEVPRLSSVQQTDLPTPKAGEPPW